MSIVFSLLNANANANANVNATVGQGWVAGLLIIFMVTAASFINAHTLAWVPTSLLAAMVFAFMRNGHRAKVPQNDAILVMVLASIVMACAAAGAIAVLGMIFAFLFMTAFSVNDTVTCTDADLIASTQPCTPRRADRQELPCPGAPRALPAERDMSPLQLPVNALFAQFTDARTPPQNRQERKCPWAPARPRQPFDVLELRNPGYAN